MKRDIINTWEIEEVTVNSNKVVHETKDQLRVEILDKKGYKRTLYYDLKYEKYVDAIEDQIVTTINEKHFISITKLEEGIQQRINQRIKADEDYQNKV